jgi:hypothetical protein
MPNSQFGHAGGSFHVWMAPPSSCPLAYAILAPPRPCRKSGPALRSRSLPRSALPFSIRRPTRVHPALLADRGSSRPAQLAFRNPTASAHRSGALPGAAVRGSAAGIPHERGPRCGTADPHGGGGWSPHRSRHSRAAGLIAPMTGPWGQEAHRLPRGPGGSRDPPGTRRALPVPADGSRLPVPAVPPAQCHRGCARPCPGLRSTMGLAPEMLSLRRADGFSHGKRRCARPVAAALPSIPLAFKPLRHP